MKKIIISIVLLALILASFVSAWGATRTININEVTINVNETGGESEFTIQETVSGATVTSYPANCGLSSGVLTCDSDSPSQRTIVYQTSGSGSVDGVIVGIDSGESSSTQKTITGDTEIGISPSPPEIKINEVEANPAGSDSGNEWVELYNPTASSVDITGWKITANGNEHIIGSSIPAEGYYVADLTGLFIDNVNEIVILKDGSDTIVDTTPSHSDEDNDDNSWQRVPDGNDNWVFKTSTQDATNDETPSDEDDLMVNYVRGKITMEGLDAPAGTKYEVLILTGANAGYIYSGEVDENVPISKQGEGYYDTLDDSKFNTGDNFKVTLINSSYDCYEEGIFENGGNGDFNTGEGLINLNCWLPNDIPVLDPIGNKEVDENQEITFTVSGSDGDVLTFDAGPLPGTATFNPITRIFYWLTDFFDAGTYIIEFNVTDGQDTDRENVTMTVNNINRAPELDFISNQTIIEDDSGSFPVAASDEDNDTLVYSVSGENINEVNCDLIGNIVSFVPVENWNGNASCEITVSDGQDTDSQIFYIEVLSVNDPPIFEGQIANITMDEDEELINYLNLNNYFSDPDDDLVFDVTGNVNIQIDIDDGWISIYPDDDWSGERNVVFSAEDNLEKAYSNAIKINVLELQEPPEFNHVSCNQEILEDTQESCQLNVTDFENDSITFSIIQWDNLECQIDSTQLLEYVGEENYNGEASCTIRASDGSIYTDFLLEVNITPVNDIPIIENYNPENPVKIVENKDEEFNVMAFDVDGDELDFSWFLNSEDTGEDSNGYLFNQEEGVYNLEVFVSDSLEQASQLWNVIVGDISEFTCEEVNGYVCQEDEICSEDYLGVYDNERCCPVRCSEKPPEFDDAKRCENITEKIRINIKEPDSGEDFKIGDLIDVEIEIDNDFDEDLDFEVYAYLYNLDEDESVEEEKDDLDIDEGEDEKIDFEFLIPENIEDGDEHVIYVFVEDDDEEYCNEAWVDINIKREKHDVIIEDIKADPLTISPGDYLDFMIDLKNKGSTDEDVSLIIQNSKLGISEEVEEFELEEFGDDDEVKKRLQIKVPENAEGGSYNIRTTAIFESNSDSKDVEIYVQAFEDLSNQDKRIYIGEEPKESVEEEVKLIPILMIVLLILIPIVTLIVLLFILFS